MRNSTDSSLFHSVRLPAHVAVHPLRSFSPCEQTGESFRIAFQELRRKFPIYKQIRKDANSLYRLIGFCYLCEQLLKGDLRQLANLFSSADFSLLQNTQILAKGTNILKQNLSNIKSHSSFKDIIYSVSQVVNEPTKHCDFILVSLVRLQAFNFTRCRVHLDCLYQPDITQFSTISGSVGLAVQLITLQNAGFKPEILQNQSAFYWRGAYSLLFRESQFEGASFQFGIYGSQIIQTVLFSQKKRILKSINIPAVALDAIKDSQQKPVMASKSLTIQFTKPARRMKESHFAAPISESSNGQQQISDSCMTDYFTDLSLTIGGVPNIQSTSLDRSKPCVTFEATKQQEDSLLNDISKRDSFMLQSIKSQSVDQSRKGQFDNRLTLLPQTPVEKMLLSKSFKSNQSRLSLDKIDNHKKSRFFFNSKQKQNQKPYDNILVKSRQTRQTRQTITRPAIRSLEGVRHVAIQTKQPQSAVVVDNRSCLTCLSQAQRRGTVVPAICPFNKIHNNPNDNLTKVVTGRDWRKPFKQPGKIRRISSPQRQALRF